MTGTHQRALMGIDPPTGRRGMVDGMSLSRFRGGKLGEDWVQWDVLGLMRQLGAGMSQQADTSGMREAEQAQQPPSPVGASGVGALLDPAQSR